MDISTWFEKCYKNFHRLKNLLAAPHPSKILIIRKHTILHTWSSSEKLLFQSMLAAVLFDPVQMEKECIIRRWSKLFFCSFIFIIEQISFKRYIKLEKKNLVPNIFFRFLNKTIYFSSFFIVYTNTIFAWFFNLKAQHFSICHSKTKLEKTWDFRVKRLLKKLKQ